MSPAVTQHIRFLLLIVYAQKPSIIAPAGISREARSLNFCLSVHLHPYFEYVSRENSCKSEPSLLSNAISAKVLLKFHEKSWGGVSVKSVGLNI